MAARHKQSKQDEIASRRAQVAALRLSQYSQAEIAARLDVSVGTVNSDLQALREEWAERRFTSYDSWVEEELATLDKMQRAFLPLALSGQTSAADRVLAVMDRRAKLVGLDKPQQHEHRVITRDVVEAEIERLEAQIAEEEARRAAESQLEQMPELEA